MAYIKFQLEDGTQVFIESSDAPRGSSGLIPGRGGEHAEQTALSFQKSVEAVGKMAASMLNGLRQGDGEQPEEVQVNFGLKASADVSTLVVSRGGMEANFNVMLRWRSEKKGEDRPGVETKDGE